MQQNKDYVPLFELGVINQQSTTPVVKVFGEFEIDSALLSILLVTLWDHAVNRLEESKQNDFEVKLQKEFKKLLERRFELNIMKRHYDVK
jgi:hypothetical protein